LSVKEQLKTFDVRTPAEDVKSKQIQQPTLFSKASSERGMRVAAHGRQARRPYLALNILVHIGL
jgi:hypothetical protein